MNTEEYEVVSQGIPEIRGPVGIAEQRAEIGEAHEDALAVHHVIERLPQGLDQRQYHHRRIDRHAGQQEYENMPAHRALAGDGHVRGLTHGWRSLSSGCSRNPSPRAVPVFTESRNRSIFYFYALSYAKPLRTFAGNARLYPQKARPQSIVVRWRGKLARALAARATWYYLPALIYRACTSYRGRPAISWRRLPAYRFR